MLDCFLTVITHIGLHNKLINYNTEWYSVTNFTVLSFLYSLAVAAMFTLPKFYEVKKVQIDQYVDVAMSKFDDCYSRCVLSLDMCVWNQHQGITSHLLYSSFCRYYVIPIYLNVLFRPNIYSCLFYWELLPLS